MKIIFSILVSVILFLVSCKNNSIQDHNGTYTMSNSVLDSNINSDPELIINGDKAKYFGKICSCTQFSDRVEIGDNKVAFIKVDGDLIVDIVIDTVRFIKLSGETNFSKN